MNKTPPHAWELFHWLGEQAHAVSRWAEDQFYLRREAPEELPDG